MKWDIGKLHAIGRLSGSNQGVVPNMRLMKKARRTLILYLWESGTEWYETFCAWLLILYAAWIAVLGTPVMSAFPLMHRIAPPLAWATFFCAVGVFTLVGLATRSSLLRSVSAYATVTVWGFFIAQFIVLEHSRLGIPTFGAAALATGWVLVRLGVAYEQEKKRNRLCGPTPN